MVIDSHIHVFHPQDMPGPEDDSYLQRQPTYLRLLFTPTKYNHTRQGWVSFEELIETLDREGIDRVCTLGPENKHTAEMFRRYPDRLIPFCYIDMASLMSDREKTLKTMQRYIEEEGFFGFGEHHPDLIGHELYSPEIQAVCELAVELDVPINLHVSEAAGHFYYGKSHNPLEEYLWLARRFPTLKVILAHWGGGLPFFEAIPEVRRVLRNVYYDTTASKLFFDVRKSMEQIAGIIDSRKIFYGSDFPILLHPDEFPDERSPRFVTDRSDFLQSELSPEILDGIMGKNFARFIGILQDEESAFYNTFEVEEPPLESEPAIKPDASTLMIVMAYPEAAVVLADYGLPYEDRRVPPWLPVIQPAAQKDIWFADGFASALRAALPQDDPKRKLNDLDLMHENIGELAQTYPEAQKLFESHGIFHFESFLPPFETLEQTAARCGLEDITPLLEDLYSVMNKESA
ncbi:MAG: TatD family hydrolase [Verrucomicrobiota bacterium]